MEKYLEIDGGANSRIHFKLKSIGPSVMGRRVTRGNSSFFDFYLIVDKESFAFIDLTKETKNCIPAE